MTFIVEPPLDETPWQYLSVQKHIKQVSKAPRKFYEKFKAKNKKCILTKEKNFAIILLIKKDISK